MEDAENLPPTSVISKAVKILFCTAHFNEWCHIQFAYSLRETKFPVGAEVRIASCMGCSCEKAMDTFAKACVDENYDIMVFACNDAGWKPDAVLQLIADDKDVVSGWSGGRFHPFGVKAFTKIFRDRCQMACDPDLNKQIKDGKKHGLERVYSVAGELQVYKVDVFRRIPYPWFSGVCNPKGEPTTPDFAFGFKCYDAGVETYVDWDVPLKHHSAGMMTENGQLRPMV